MTLEQLLLAAKGRDALYQLCFSAAALQVFDGGIIELDRLRRLLRHGYQPIDPDTAQVLDETLEALDRAAEKLTALVRRLGDGRSIARGRH